MGSCSPGRGVAASTEVGVTHDAYWAGPALVAPLGHLPDAGAARGLTWRCWRSRCCRAWSSRGSEAASAAQAPHPAAEQGEGQGEHDQAVGGDRDRQDCGCLVCLFV